MVRLEMYKKKVFFDYAKVDKYLKQMRQRNRGELPTDTPVKSLMLNSTDGLAKLDDQYAPLSSRQIVDCQEHLTYRQPNVPGKSNRHNYEMETRNLYFD